MNKVMTKHCHLSTKFQTRSLPYVILTHFTDSQMTKRQRILITLPKMQDENRFSDVLVCYAATFLHFIDHANWSSTCRRFRKLGKLHASVCENLTFSTDTHVPERVLRYLLGHRTKVLFDLSSKTNVLPLLPTCGNLIRFSSFSARPGNVAHMIDLRHLSLFCDNFTGMRNMSALTELQVLSLKSIDGNTKTGWNPSAFKSMSSLVHLSMELQLFDSKFKKALASSGAKLTHLDLDGSECNTEVRGDDLEFLATMSLHTLKITGMWIEDKSWSLFRNLHLRKLHLELGEASDRFGTEELKSVVSGSPNLTHLTLDNTDLLDDDMEMLIKDTPELKSLHITSNVTGDEDNLVYIGDMAIPHFMQMPSLAFLSVSSNSFTSVGISMLATKLNGDCMYVLKKSSVNDLH